MHTGRMAGLMLLTMRLGRWRGQSEQFGPQRDELAARLENSFCRYLCVLCEALCSLRMSRIGLLL